MPGEAASRRVTRGTTRQLVVACGCSMVQHARLQDALRGAGQLLSLRELSGLSQQLNGALRVPDLIVLSVSVDSARDVVTLVRGIRVHWPRSAIVAYCGGIRETPASIGALAAAGVHQFLFTDLNDRGSALSAILASARQQCVAEVVLTTLRRSIPAAIHPMVEAALLRPANITGVRELADAIGVHRKTLFNRCEQASFFGPAELLTWTRLALVAYLLESTGYTVENIALELGFPSPTALRNTMKRYTGLRPMEIRGAGGLTVVVARLDARLSAFRARGLPASERADAELHIL